MSKNKSIQILPNINLYTAGAKAVAIGKTDEGKTVLVTGAVPGDVVDVRVKKSKSKYVEGTVANLIAPSPDRIAPMCLHFGVCGGCKWQNLSYEKQLYYKTEEIYNNIQRIGGMEPCEKLPIMAADFPYHYRNKMEFSFSDARWLSEHEIKTDTEITNKNALGFHIPGMWSKILDLKECHLQEEPSNRIRLEVKAYAEAHQLEFFDIKNKAGFLRNMMLRQNSKGEWMLAFQLFKDIETERIAFFEHLKSEFSEIKTILYAINNKQNDSIYDLDYINYFGDGYLMEEMDGLKFRIGVKSFFQTNYHQAKKLYQKTLEFADLKGNETVFDLYTGTGTIAQFVSKHAKQVIGIESVEEAVLAAKENAKLNGIDNCSFYCGDMKTVFNEVFLSQHPKADVLITDPPRDGMHPKVVEQILKLSPDRIVYVSCNSATQARDIALMKEQYKLVKLLPVDMFPQTHHVESIALLEKIL